MSCASSAVGQFSWRTIVSCSSAAASQASSSSFPSRQTVRYSFASSGCPLCGQSESVIFTPVLKPVSYGSMAMCLASARGSWSCSPRDLTSMSLLLEGTMAQVVGPDLICIDRSEAFSVTVCFFPAIVQRSPSRVTVTSGAPHSARGSGCVAACFVCERTSETSSNESVIAIAIHRRMNRSSAVGIGRRKPGHVRVLRDEWRALRGGDLRVDETNAAGVDDVHPRFCREVHIRHDDIFNRHLRETKDVPGDFAAFGRDVADADAPPDRR